MTEKPAPTQEGVEPTNVDRLFYCPARVYPSVAGVARRL